MKSLKWSVSAAVLLVGCGQTGALVLPSDPEADQRVHYLLYKNLPAQTDRVSDSSSSQSKDLAISPLTVSPQDQP